MTITIYVSNDNLQKIDSFLKETIKTSHDIDFSHSRHHFQDIEVGLSMNDYMSLCDNMTEDEAVATETTEAVNA